MIQFVKIGRTTKKSAKECKLREQWNCIFLMHAIWGMRTYCTEKWVGHNVLWRPKLWIPLCKFKRSPARCLFKQWVKCKAKTIYLGDKKIWQMGSNHLLKVLPSSAKKIVDNFWQHWSLHGWGLKTKTNALFTRSLLPCQPFSNSRKCDARVEDQNI